MWTHGNARARALCWSHGDHCVLALQRPAPSTHQSIRPAGCFVAAAIELLRGLARQFVPPRPPHPTRGGCLCGCHVPKMYTGALLDPPIPPPPPLVQATLGSWVQNPVGMPLGFLFTCRSGHLNPVPAEGKGGKPDLPRRTVAAPLAPYLWMNCDSGFAAMPGNALNARA